MCLLQQRTNPKDLVNQLASCLTRFFDSLSRKSRVGSFVLCRLICFASGTYVAPGQSHPMSCCTQTRLASFGWSPLIESVFQAKAPRGFCQSSFVGIGLDHRRWLRENTNMTRKTTEQLPNRLKKNNFDMHWVLKTNSRTLHSLRGTFPQRKCSMARKKQHNREIRSKTINKQRGHQN